MKVLISNDDGNYFIISHVTHNTNIYKQICAYSIGPPSLEESPFILPFIEHLENLGWDVK